MKYFLSLFSLFFLSFSFAQSLEGGVVENDVALDSELPNISLQSLDGESINIQELTKDNPSTIIAFWATWCMPCIKELNAINDVITDWEDETDVKFYAVSIDDAKTVSRVRPMVDGKAWDFDVLLDTNNDLKRALSIPTVPHVVLVKDGKIAYRHVGYQPGSEVELYEELISTEEK